MKIVFGALALLISFNGLAAEPVDNSKVVAICSGLTTNNVNAVHLVIFDRFDQNLEAEIRSTNGESGVFALKKVKDFFTSPDGNKLRIFPNGEFKNGATMMWSSQTLSSQFMFISLNCTEGSEI